MNQPKKIVFAPGVLEQMEKDFTPEEMQEALDEISRLANNPDAGVPVDLTQLMQEDPNLYGQIVSQLEAMEENNVPPTLQ